MLLLWAEDETRFRSTDKGYAKGGVGQPGSWLSKPGAGQPGSWLAVVIFSTWLVSPHTVEVVIPRTTIAVDRYLIFKIMLFYLHPSKVSLYIIHISHAILKFLLVHAIVTFGQIKPCFVLFLFISMFLG
jgi:hypothetical protein